MPRPPCRLPTGAPSQGRGKYHGGWSPHMWQKWNTAWGWACPWQVAAQVSLLSLCAGKSHLQLVPICTPFGVSSPAPWLSPRSQPTLPMPQAPVHPCWPHHGPSAFSHFLGPTKLGVSHPAAWASAPRSPRRGGPPQWCPLELFMGQFCSCLTGLLQRASSGSLDAWIHGAAPAQMRPSPGDGRLHLSPSAPWAPLNSRALHSTQLPRSDPILHPTPGSLVFSDEGRGQKREDLCPAHEPLRVGCLLLAKRLSPDRALSLPPPTTPTASKLRDRSAS